MLIYNTKRPLAAVGNRIRFGWRAIGHAQLIVQDTLKIGMGYSRVRQLVHTCREICKDPPDALQQSRL